MIEAINAVDLEESLSDEYKDCIVIASLLHDVDDKKFFNTIDYQNARDIIKRIPKMCAFEDLIIEMIDLVSCSKNGNMVVGNHIYSIFSIMNK